MKTYKINGKEISEAYEGLHVSGDYLAGKINQLLEALSDKEEDYSYLDNLEQISHCCKAKIFFKGAGKGLWCSSCKKEVFHTEYVEELKQEELVERDPIMRNRHIICPVKPKQSTSLKEEILLIIQNSSFDEEFAEDVSNKVIKLIQSYILKEIESKKIKNDVEPKGGNWNTQDVINLQNTLLEDIIKIISNISK